YPCSIMVAILLLRSLHRETRGWAEHLELLICQTEGYNLSSHRPSREELSLVGIPGAEDNKQGTCSFLLQSLLSPRVHTSICHSVMLLKRILTTLYASAEAC
ncbi:hypothetical protein MKW98_027002, partial [Papaver atlanticum]